METPLAKLQTQLSERKVKAELQTGGFSKTMVVGGFGVPSVLGVKFENKLETLMVPKHVGPYIKSQEFQRLFFAKFARATNRDMALGRLRSARFHESIKHTCLGDRILMGAHSCRNFLLVTLTQKRKWAMKWLCRYACAAWTGGKQKNAIRL